MSSSTLAPPRIVRVQELHTRAPAKLNLTLRVLHRRPDGFHELESLVIGVGLYDRVRCATAHRPGVELECDEPTLIGEDNLAVRAARKLAEHCGVAPALGLQLKKGIPIGAGLGGGSADAAVALRLCNELWATHLTEEELAAIGGEIGSDVPLFFSLPACVMEGRGERVRAVSMRWSGWAMIVYPGFAVSTAEVYAAWQPADTKGACAGNLIEALQARSADELERCLVNHLEPAVFRVCPPLGDLVRELKAMGLGTFRVTGSGSAVYRLWDEENAARAAASRIRERWNHASVCGVAAPVGLDTLDGEES